MNVSFTFTSSTTLPVSITVAIVISIILIAVNAETSLGEWRAPGFGCSTLFLPVQKSLDFVQMKA